MKGNFGNKAGSNHVPMSKIKHMIYDALGFKDMIALI